MRNTWVICIDGTWNAPGQTDTDPIDHQEDVTKTNVQILWEALAQKTLDHQSPYGSIQPLINQPGTVLYLNGVGSSGSERQRNFEGTTGTGTSERILDAYQFLAQRWQLGDNIFIYGFSRGAFAARSLTGFIDCVGLPEHCRLLSGMELLSLYENYRKSVISVTKPVGMVAADIHFVGVWDTVGALAFGDGFNHFHQLSPGNVQHICQALALDEQRKQFLPEYFRRTSDSQKIEEVWFAGAHSNIGGGYVDANLSNIALFWMLKKSQQVGLEIELAGVPGWSVQNPEGEIRQSYSEFWGSMPDMGKLIQKFNVLKVSRAIQEGQLLHASVVDAMNHGYTPAAHRSDHQTLGQLAVESWGFK